MRRAALALGLLALAGAAVGCSQANPGGSRPSVVADTSPGARPQSQRRLVFHADFSAAKLDGRRWNRCHWWAEGGCTIASNSELEWYLPGQVRVRNGRVRLVAERRAVRGSDGKRYPYRSGMISSGPPSSTTRAKYAFRYGRAEIRARVPAGKGLWSAFWLLPADRRSKPEIDVMEILGHRPETLEMHLHYRDREGHARQRGREWRDRGLRRGWHRFAVDWRPGRLAWLVDGVVRWRVRGKAVPSERMYLVANLAVGGEWPGAPNAATRFPSALVIDHVKVWR